MKVDAHIHSKGISKCSGVEYRDVIDEKKKLGYNAIIRVFALTFQLLY